MTDIALLGTTIAGLAATFFAFNTANNKPTTTSPTTTGTNTGSDTTVNTNTPPEAAIGNTTSNSATQLTLLSIDGEAVNNIRQIGFEKGIVAFQKTGSGPDTLEYRNNLLLELKKFIVSEAFGLQSFSNFTFSNEASLLQGDLKAFHIFVNKILYELKLVIY